MQSHSLGPNAVVHIHSCGEGGIFVNAYFVETANGVVAVDSTLTESESKAFRSELDALRKPLLAVLITHPHPDHVAGITNLVMKDNAKIIATQSVVDLMRNLEEPKRKQWTPVYGAEWVQQWTYPNTVAASGDKFTFDGVTYSVLDIGPGGDSEANSIWFVESPARTAFLSDLVFNGTHSYVADGYLLAWLANLNRLEGLCRGMDIVFPGHGVPGAPQPLIAQQRDYLLALAGHVKDVAQGRKVLDDSSKQEIEKRMIAQYPNAALTFLIGMNVDPLARELSGPR